MALERPEDLLEMADGFTRMADDAHARILASITRGELDQAAAQALFQQEVSLRQKANGLYADAASRVISGLQLPQTELMSVLESASKTLRTLDDLRRFTDLFADLIVLSTCITAGKPEPILSALDEIRKNLSNHPTAQA